MHATPNHPRSRGLLPWSVLGALLFAGTAQATEVLIDFETDAYGNPLLEGDSVATVFPGVTFSVPEGQAIFTNLDPFIAVEGAPPRTAYNGTPTDAAASGVNIMSDGYGIISSNYVAEFDAPVDAVSLLLLDYGDCRVGGAADGTPMPVSLVAYDDMGAEVDVDTLEVFKGPEHDTSIKELVVAAPGIVKVSTEGANHDCDTAVDDFWYFIDDEPPPNEDDCNEDHHGNDHCDNGNHHGWEIRVQKRPGGLHRPRGWDRHSP